MRSRVWLASAAGVAVAVALLAWAFDRAGGTRFVEPLGTVATWVLVPALLCEVTVWVCKAWKWTGILASTRRVRFRSALKAVLVGGAATHVVPLRIDELLRAKILGDSEGLPAATVLGTVAIDRVLEILVLGSLLGVIAITGNLTGPLEVAVKVAWAGFLGGATVLTIFVFAEAPTAAFLARWTGPGAKVINRLAGIVSELARGLRSLPRGRDLVVVLLATAGEWTATIVMYGLVFVGFGLKVAAEVPLVLAVGGAAAYGVPNVPGAVGTFEATQVTLLEQLLALPPDEALALAIVAHGVLAIPITLVGSVVGLSIWLRRSAHLVK